MDKQPHVYAASSGPYCANCNSGDIRLVPVKRSPITDQSKPTTYHVAGEQVSEAVYEYVLANWDVNTCPGQPQP